MSSTSTRAFCLLAVSTAAFCLLGATAQPAGQSPGYPCVSRPSDVREMGFSIRGTVGELLVTPGQTVAVGELLVRLDDSVQRAIVEYATLQASDDSTVRLAQSELEYRAKEAELIESTRINQATGSDAQVRESRYQHEQAKITVEAAKTQSKLRATELAREKAQLAQMSILSPFAGTVLDVRKRAGETVDEGSPVLTLVSVNPLWLDASIPIKESASVKVGASASVVFEDWDNKSPFIGKVIYKSPAGNAGARQVQIRVEIPNPGLIPSGLHGRLALE